MTAVESSRAKATALIGEDTDLLVLLSYHANLNSPRNLFFIPKTTSSSAKVWNVKKTKRALGENFCSNILILHAILGCDTAL